MNPNTVFSASLVTSLALWFPSMQACLRGDLDLAPAGLRYLAALLVARLAWGGLARLVNAYHTAQEPPAAGPEGAVASPPKRRRDDHGADDAADPETLAA